LARPVAAALIVVAPFVVIAGLFAGALVRHLGAQTRAAQRLEQALASDALPAAGVADDDFVALTRLPCFGACPGYRVRIDGGGRVEFAGQVGVCAQRPPPTSIGRANAQRLLAALRQARLEALPRVVGRRSELPGKMVELRLGGVSHRIVDNGGPAGEAPLLDVVADAIDRVSGDARWLPRKRSGAAPYCALPDGRKAVFTRDGERLLLEPETSAASGVAAGR
jgi:hypothetical protein